MLDAFGCPTELVRYASLDISGRCRCLIVLLTSIAYLSDNSLAYSTTLSNSKLANLSLRSATNIRQEETVAVDFWKALVQKIIQPTKEN